MPTVPPDHFVEPNELSRYGVPSDFLAQFALMPFEVQIVDGGALGAMTFAWRRVGETSYSLPFASTSGATWGTTIDDVFADLVFAAGTYTAGHTYRVGGDGSVTPEGSATAGLITAARFDLRASACSAASSEALYLMSDAVRPPVTAWGDEVRVHCASLVYATLKRARGATPSEAGEGDALVFSGEKSARAYFSDIGEHGKPDNLTDTSTSSDGPMMPIYPAGDPLRNW